MMVEAQKIFTDTTMQDPPTDFLDLARSFQRRAKLPKVAASVNFQHLIDSSAISADIGSDAIAEKPWSLEQAVLLFRLSAASHTPSLPDTAPETGAFEYPALFSALYHRKVLFTKEIEIQPGKLRRWKPQRTFDPSLLSEAEDD